MYSLLNFHNLNIHMHPDLDQEKGIIRTVVVVLNK